MTLGNLSSGAECFGSFGCCVIDLSRLRFLCLEGLPFRGVSAIVAIVEASRRQLS